MEDFNFCFFWNPYGPNIMICIFVCLEFDFLFKSILAHCGDSQRLNILDLETLLLEIIIRFMHKKQSWASLIKFSIAPDF